MSYTPDPGGAVVLSLGGPYTPPPGSSVPLPPLEAGTADLRGLGIMGAPVITATVTPVAMLAGSGLLGAATLVTSRRPLAGLLGLGLLGVPVTQVNAAVTTATLRAAGLLGIPQAQTWYGVMVRLAGAGTLGAPRLRALPRTLATLRGIGILGAPQARLWGLPAAAVTIPPGVTYYFCKLTGAPDGLADLILPISSFSVRHRPGAPSYYQITIPSYAYVSDLAARPNGEIVIWSEQAGVSEELARGDLGQVAIARGPESQSISISGNADRAELPHLTYVIPEALYVASSFSGDTRLRIEPRARIRPGDYVRYQDLNMAVGEVTWAVSVSAGGLAATMELVSIPVESGA